MDFHDLISSTSHLVTAGWGVFATLILLRLTRHHGIGQISVGIFGFTMVTLYLASGLFHGVYHETRESFRLYQRIDQSAIYLLIAGSYTPVFVYFLNGTRRKAFLGVLWGLAFLGSASLWIFPAMPHAALVGVYCGMGLVGMLPIYQYYRVGGRPAVIWTLTVVAAYVLGAIIEVAKWPDPVPGWFGPHEILHIADLSGTILHFGFIMTCVIRKRPLRDRVPQGRQPAFVPIRSKMTARPVGI